MGADALSPITSVYNTSWFRRRMVYRPAYHAFARAIEDLWHPSSVLDIGCGAGWILEHFLGRVSVHGVDGSQAALDAQPFALRQECALRDLTYRSDMYAWAREWDLAVSIEVAEHIPAEHADDFLAWFNNAQRVLLTAAPPGQGGLWHVNEQPQSYWRDKMQARGFDYSFGSTEAWKRLARLYTKGCPWVVRNAMVYIRRSLGEGGSSAALSGKEAA